MNIGARFVHYAVAGAMVLAANVVLNRQSHAPIGMVVTDAHAEGIRSFDSVCDWEELTWDEMSGAEQQAWQALGWSPELWNSENPNAAASSSKDWSKLTPKEKNAAEQLGFSAETWEIKCPPSSQTERDD